MDPAAIDTFEAFVLGLGHDEETARQARRIFRRCVQLALAVSAEGGALVTAEVAENYCFSLIILRFPPHEDPPNEDPPTPAPTQPDQTPL